MAKKLKTTFLSCETLDLISIMLQVSSTRSVDTLATNIYLDMQKEELTQKQVNNIRRAIDKSYANIGALFIITAIKLALKNYVKYDLVK